MLKLLPTSFLSKVWLGSLPKLLLQLVLSHSSPLDLHIEVDMGRCCEAETVRDLGQVELVYVEEVALLVRGVGLEVGTVAVLGRTVQVVVALDQLHELLLHVRELGLGELVLVWLDLGLL